jgi:hypothetical protein
MDALHLSAPACDGTKPKSDALGVANSYSHKHANANRDAHRDPRTVVNAFGYTWRSYGYCS